MKHLTYSLFTPSHLKYSIRELKRLEAYFPSARSRFAIPFVFKGKGFFKSIACMQNPSEIEILYETIIALKPKNILEIGTAKGGCLYLWLQAALDGATVVSVDLPGGEFGGGYSESRIPLYEAFAKKEQKLHLVRSNSSLESTLNHVKNLFLEPIDFIFIDGDHTYEGVKRDFELYSPLVRPGGLIGFHDILPRNDITNIQVDRFWGEIRSKYKTTEIIASDHWGRKFGTGLIHV